MSLAATAAGAVAAGRRAAEALMVDVCTITHGTGAATLNETTGRRTLTTSTVYSGPCRVQVPQAQPQTSDVAERSATVQQLTISIPVTATGVAVGAVVTVTASALDPELAGRVFRVSGVHHKTHATARRLACEETTA